MENIINRILEIDQTARERLQHAEQTKAKIIAAAKEEEAKIIGSVDERVASRISKIDNEEKKRADEKIDEIHRVRDMSFTKLDNIFMARSDSWERDILAGIIG